ncbi:hypothetical protein K449DRAFT_431165 [Hypoxylon sp. EC38]|nr:hypothetical protein K449DRAFT_431165 [Hypoxylon sp. EC38]
MGHWGMRLFEGDQDLDVALEIDATFGEGQNVLHLTKMIHQTDMIAPVEARLYYETSEYEEELAQLVTKARVKLNADDLGHRLIRHWREKEDKHYGKYRVIIAGALLMRAGATIQESEMQHLRELVPHINCNHVFTFPLFDEGFRGPGRAQFLAALENYQPGVPRNFQEPSCFHCGKVQADLGKAPSACGGCKEAWYCDRVGHSLPICLPWFELIMDGIRTVRRLIGNSTSQAALIQEEHRVLIDNPRLIPDDHRESILVFIVSTGYCVEISDAYL